MKSWTASGGMVREAQRQAWHTLEHVTVVPAADLALYDFIHNASEGNLVVGERCARAALAECYGRDVDWMAPEPESVVQTAPDTVTVRFFAHPQLAQSLWRARGPAAL